MMRETQRALETGRRRELRQLIADWDSALEGGFGDAETAAGMELRNALEQLVDDSTIWEV